MNEAIATGEGRATRQFEVLYRTWVEGGSGLLVTGNVMVDKRHANEPSAMAVKDREDFLLLELNVQAGCECTLACCYSPIAHTL